MLFRSLMLAVLMAPADGDGGGGGGAQPPAAAPPAPPAAGAPASGEGEEKVSLTRKELDEKFADRAKRAAKSAREELLGRFKDAGITSEEDLEKLVKAHASNLEAQKSEFQKLNERASKAEKEAELLRNEAASAKEEARRVRLFAGAGVKDADIAGFLLDKARADDKDLDEKKWLEGLRKEKPYLFGEEAPAPVANSGRKREGAGAPSNGSGSPADLSKLSPEERRRAAIAAGVDPRLIGA